MKEETKNRVDDDDDDEERKKRKEKSLREKWRPKLKAVQKN